MKPVVLIVDDSLTVRMDLAEAFDDAGFCAVPCGTAAEARAALTRETPALVVLDVILPDASGIDLLKEIRSSTAPATPVLMLSTEAEVKDRIAGLRTGADDYVGKPYDVGYLVERARELIGGPLAAEPAPTATTILVVDDGETFRRALEAALVGAGYRVLTATTGEEGLRVAAANRPNAILVDGIMPGMDGITMIRRVRLDAALRTTPSILLTGSLSRDAELSALDAGADAFVRKEDELEVILARLAAVLRSASEGRTHTKSLASPRRILAVDDSPTYLEEIGEVLRGEGYDVVLARSGEEAIELLAVQPVDCILLDLAMPGMGGIETCRRVKASKGVGDVPLIILTGHDDRASMVESLAAGADDYIAKSNEIEVLKARVAAQLRRKQFEEEHRRVREELLHSELVATEERAAREVAETRAALVGELERKNRELETFSYSVSHDLRAPLRSIDGFSLALLEDCGEQLDETGKRHLERIRSSAQRMGELIDDLLELSRVGRAEIDRVDLNLAELAHRVVAVLRDADPARDIEIVIDPDLQASADARLVRIVLENLFNNAWKFTKKVAAPAIVFSSSIREGGRVYFVKDNGAGFDMKTAGAMFGAFRRFHDAADFPGTGVGLATVHRIIERHGGRIWAESAVGAGATFFFDLPRAGSSRLPGARS